MYQVPFLQMFLNVPFHLETPFTHVTVSTFICNYPYEDTFKTMHCHKCGTYFQKNCDSRNISKNAPIFCCCHLKISKCSIQYSNFFVESLRLSGLFSFLSLFSLSYPPPSQACIHHDHAAMGADVVCWVLVQYVICRVLCAGWWCICTMQGSVC